METIEAIQKRRAVKHYDPSHKMTKEELDQILSLTLLSPTSFNIQNWRFVVVENAQIRQQIREAAWNQAQVTEASLLVVLCADLKSWEKDPNRYWVNAPEEARNFLVPAIIGYYKDKEQLWRDEAMRSCGIAAQTLMLTAKSLGYDSCPMVGFDFDQVSAIINLPESHVVTMLVTIGKAVKPAYPRGGQLSKEEVIIYNQFK